MFVVGAMFFTGASVQAMGNGNNLMQNIGVITQLIQIIDRYPQLSDTLQPLVDRMVNSLVSDIDEYKNKGQKVKTVVKERNEIRKDLKKGSRAITADSELVRVMAEPYENIDGKWEVKVRFDNKAQVKMYVYDIDSMDELAMAIAEKINAEFGIEVSADTVEAILKIEDEDDDSDNDEELEIEVEIEDGVAEIKVEIDGEEYEFTLSETDRDLIVEYIADKFNLSVSDVEDVVEFE